MMPKLTAEFLGTFWLVLGGCGSAVLAAAFPNVGIGLLGVSLAFGLTVVTGAYALGPVSGGHFNPAVSVGLWAGGRFPASELLPYVAAQVAGCCRSWTRSWQPLSSVRLVAIFSAASRVAAPRGSTSACRSSSVD